MLPCTRKISQFWVCFSELAQYTFADVSLILYQGKNDENDIPPTLCFLEPHDF